MRSGLARNVLLFAVGLVSLGVEKVVRTVCRRRCADRAGEDDSPREPTRARAPGDRPGPDRAPPTGGAPRARKISVVARPAASGSGREG